MPDGNKISTLLTAPLPRRFLSIPLIALASLIVSFILGYWMHSRRSPQVIASQRVFFRHSRFSNALPASVVVTVKRTSTGYVAAVESSITYSRFSTGYRTLALVPSPSEEDALARWAFVDWGADGVRVGKGTNQFLISQKELEAGGR